MYESSINTFGLFANNAVGTSNAGGTAASDPLYVGDVNKQNRFTVTYRVGASGLAATAATVNFNYQVSNRADGVFVTPTNGDKGTIGTAGSGAAGSRGALSFTPVVAPWMKILAIAGTSGTALVSAELHVQ